MINELAPSQARSDNVYFINNEQVSIAFFTTVFIVLQNRIQLNLILII